MCSRCSVDAGRWRKLLVALRPLAFSHSSTTMSCFQTSSSVPRTGLQITDESVVSASSIICYSFCWLNISVVKFVTLPCLCSWPYMMRGATDARRWLSSHLKSWITCWTRANCWRIMSWFRTTWTSPSSQVSLREVVQHLPLTMAMKSFWWFTFQSRTQSHRSMYIHQIQDCKGSLKLCVMGSIVWVVVFRLICLCASISWFYFTLGPSKHYSAIGTFSNF